MTNKLALTASVIMLVATSGGAIAGSGPKARTQWYAASPAVQNAYDSYVLDWAAPLPLSGPNVRRYRGGPKSDY